MKKLIKLTNKLFLVLCLSTISPPSTLECTWSFLNPLSLILPLVEKKNASTKKVKKKEEGLIRFLTGNDLDFQPLVASGTNLFNTISTSINAYLDLGFDMNERPYNEWKDEEKNALREKLKELKVGNKFQTFLDRFKRPLIKIENAAKAVEKAAKGIEQASKNHTELTTVVKITMLAIGSITIMAFFYLALKIKELLKGKKKPNPISNRDQESIYDDLYTLTDF